MKKFLTILMASSLLLACHSDVDLKNMDTSSEVEFGLALPVGSLRATLGDFLGDGQISQIYVDQDGIFHFMDTVEIPAKEYRSIDVASYMIKNSTALDFKIKDAVDIPAIPPTPVAIPIPFKMQLGLEGINEDKSTERIDSIWVTKADFYSTINVSDFDLNWSEIESVKLVLGQQFKRPEGDTIDIPVAGKDFGQRIDIKVDNFTLDLLVNDSDPTIGTVNMIDFDIIFYVHPSHMITVTDDSKITYDLKVDVIDYDAIWGFFQAGNQMRDERRLSLDSIWEDWQRVKRLKVRFAEPKIEVFVAHKVAAPLRMYIDYILAIDSLGQPSYATWDNETKYDFALKNSLSPLIDPVLGIHDSVYNSQVFSYEESKGHIDKLFDVRPDSFLYSFYLLVDQNPREDYPWKQHRITKDVNINAFAIADIPFKFNEGSELQYNTTLSDLNISKISLDSLLGEGGVVDTLMTSDLKLILSVSNGIPFDIDGVFTFLDKDSLPMNLQLLQDSTQNHILFPAPTMTKLAGQKYGIVSEPSVTNVIINVDKTKVEKLSEVKHIHLDASIAGNPQPCQIDTNTYVSVKIGIAAHMDAILKFTNQNNNNNTNN